ncbi:MAG: hypothetical protein QM726_10620 [Chitinophagaceae bacterium]
MSVKPVFCVCIIFFITIFFSCQKSISDFAGGSDSTGHTVASIAGVYKLKSIVWTYAGTSINIYDSLDACEKDDLYNFRSDYSFIRTDTGIVCNPPNSGAALWGIRNDSFYTVVGSSVSIAKIKSYDGTNLALQGTPPSDPTVVAVTTFTKQ